MPGPTTSDLIFSDQANHNFSKTLGAIKRSTLSIHNRLSSIEEDALFAERVASAYNRPLVANERCGSWYINPEHKGGSAYFKSTDGHTGVWKFSSRRLNLHLLEIIGGNDGCIIVDSTRRGKRMPDALSKTVPIWCNVVNRMLFPDMPESHNLYTPPQVVSESEHAQMFKLLPTFLESLLALHISVDEIRAQISKPLRPVWITPDSHISSTSEIYSEFHPVICCTVSRRVAGGEVSEGGYIQGAGDDTENWACGLTAPIFWANRQLLLSMPEYDLPDVIAGLVGSAKDAAVSKSARCVVPTSSLFVGALADIPTEHTTQTCVIAILPKITQQSSWPTSSSRLDVGLGPHKLGSRNLRSALSTVVEFVHSFLCRMENEQQDATEIKISIACESGKDFSVGTALALLCLIFDDDGNLTKTQTPRPRIDKTFIRRRLGWISTSMPDANPSRATLQSVNSYLM